jgi:hypothetical protein
MALTIKAIRDTYGEPVAQWIGIDDFDTIKGKEHYLLGTRIYGDDDSNEKIILTKEQSVDALLRGSMIMTMRKSLDRDFPKMPCDVFEKPDITMYIILGQRLKEEGIIFNKKLGKFKCAKDKKESFLS